jgi:hypothetical protein
VDVGVKAVVICGKSGTLVYLPPGLTTSEAIHAVRQGLRLGGTAWVLTSEIEKRRKAVEGTGRGSQEG